MFQNEVFAVASCWKQKKLPKYVLVINITRRRAKTHTRYSPQFKNFGDVPVDGRITLKHIYGRRLYRRELYREFNCLGLFLSGWNGGFHHKGFVSFCLTAWKF